MRDTKIYMDYSATTPMRNEVFDSIRNCSINNYGNPSSLHTYGQDAKNILDSSRRIIKQSINGMQGKVIFTSGGTESNNLAIKGFMYANKHRGKHMITTKVEHPSVLNTAKSLEKEGFSVTYLDVDSKGMLDLDHLKKSIRNDTVLISIMYINNEIGTIMPVKRIGMIARKNNVVYHTDAVQALGNININVVEQFVDLMSLSAHKIYGPKGVGGIYIRDEIAVENLTKGGSQEWNYRAGTENVPGIVGFAKATELAVANLKEHCKKLCKLRDRLAQGILSNIKYTHYNGDEFNRHPGNVNISFKYIEGEALLMRLNKRGIAASSGSACSSKTLEASHVLIGIGLELDLAQGAIRFSIGDFTTEKEIDYTIKVLVDEVDKLRNMSPFYHDFLNQVEVG